MATFIEDKRLDSVGGKFKSWLWKIVTFPLVAILCCTVNAQGARSMVPILGMPLHKLPFPFFSRLRDYEGLHRLDLAVLFSFLLLIAVWYLWTVMMWIWFAPNQFFARTGWEPEKYTRFVFALAIVILSADALLFYAGMVQEMGGLFGGAVISIPAILATVAYMSALIFVSFVSVNLQRTH
jgi:hypothetical protein